MVKGRDSKSQTWESDYQLMDKTIWRHRCTPKVNPVIGNTGGGKVGGFQSGGGGSGPSAAPALRVKPAVVPKPTPGRVQAPTDGDPATPVIRRAQ